MSDSSNNTIRTEGEYLKYCNDMKEQFLRMEERYKAEIGLLTLTISRLRSQIRLNREDRLLEGERKRNVRALLDIIKYVLR